MGRNLAKFIAGKKDLEINRALRLNQYVANDMGNSRLELIDKCSTIMSHASKCFIDFYRAYDKPDLLESLVPFTKQMQDFIDLSQQNQGYMVVAPHLSNFDLVVSSLVKHGFKGKVLSYSNPGSGYQLQNEIRRSIGMDILPLGDPNLETEIIQYLKEGGIAATGVDRPMPGRKKRHYVNFFDRPSPLPVGYIPTALAADVPVIVVTALMEEDGTYGFRQSDPIILKKYSNKMDDIKLNAERVLKRVEHFIRLVPEQWLMYYPVWPDLLTEEI